MDAIPKVNVSALSALEEKKYLLEALLLGREVRDFMQAIMLDLAEIIQYLRLLLEK
jgi:hypothetical protein